MLLLLLLNGAMSLLKNLPLPRPAAFALALFWLPAIVHSQQTVTFAHYNVENNLEMNRREGAETVFGPKPDHEKNTLIRIIKEIHPDILAVSEMGPLDQFGEFQRRLEEAGLGFPFTEYVNGADR